MKLNLMFIALISLFLSACSDDLIKNNIDNSEFVGNADELVGLDTEKHLVEFAKVLSKVVHERKDVREFLKNEALKQFDRNYNVLYYLISDELVGKEAFRDVLISYSSEEVVERIEKNVPLLNILIPEITFFEVLPEDMDTDDDEIPVAVSRESVNTLYFNGAEELDLKKDEIPGFHVFVVNENSHVIIPSE